LTARAHFVRMQDSTAADRHVIAGEFMPFAQALPGRVVKHLQILQGDYRGFPVDRYTHSLQTATRALRDGRDEEYVVCALLHDIRDTLGSWRSSARSTTTRPSIRTRRRCPSKTSCPCCNA
jgi:predicted HD phosphohydrolase